MATLEELAAEFDSLPDLTATPVSTPVATPVAVAAPTVGTGEALLGALGKAASVGKAYGGGLISGAVDLVPNTISGIYSLQRRISDPIGAAIEDEKARQAAGITKTQDILNKLEAGFEFAGRGASQVLGGLAGTPGGIPGMVAGAGAGDVAFTSLVDFLSGREQKSAEELAAQAGYTSGGALAGEGLVAGLPRAVSTGKRLAQSLDEVIAARSPEGAQARAGLAVAPVYPEAALKAGIKEMRQDPLGSQTTAELIPSTAASTLEKTVGGIPEFQVRLKDLRNESEGGQTFLLEQAAKEVGEDVMTMQPDDLGIKARENVAVGNAARAKTLKDLYADVDKKFTVTKWGSLKSGISKAADDILGGKKLIPDSLKPINDLIKEGKEFKIGNLVSWRSQVLEQARNFKKAGQAKNAGFAGAMADELTKLIEKTPTGANEWKTANKQAAPLYKLEKEGPLGGLLDDTSVPGEKIISEVSKSRSSVKQYKELTQSDPAAMLPVQAHFLRQMEAMDTAARGRFIKSKASVLEEAFGSDYASFDAMVRQNKRIADVSRKGVNQPQALSPELQRALFGREGNLNIPLGMAGKIGNFLKSAITAKPDALLKEAVFQAATNPYYAQKALTLGQALGAQRAAARVPVTFNIPQGLGGLVGGVANADTSIALPTPTPADTASRIEAKFAATDNVVMPAFAPTPEPKKKSMIEDKKVGKQEIDALLEEIPTKYGIRPSLIKAMAKVESDFNPKAVGPETKYGRAQGLMQLMPATAKALNVKDPFNPEESIEAASKLLVELTDRYGKYGDERLIVAAYNSRPATLDKAIMKASQNGDEVMWENVSRYMPKETQNYIARIF